MYLSPLILLSLAIKSMAFTSRATMPGGALGSPRATTLEGIPVPHSAGIVAATSSLIVLPMNKKINDNDYVNDDDDIIKDKKSLLVGSLKTKNMMPKLAHTVTAALLIWNTWWFSPPPSYALSAQDKKDIAESIQPMFDAIDKKFDAIDKKFEAKFDAMDKKFEAKFDAMDKRMDLTDKKIDLAVVQASVITSSIGVVISAINNNKLDDSLKRFEDQKETLKKELNRNAQLFATQGGVFGAALAVLVGVAFLRGH